MARFRWLPLFPVVLSACTPLGGYLYGDPSFALTEVRMSNGTAEAPAEDSLMFVLMGCNLNDFDLLGTSMAMSLIVQGETVGIYQSDAMYNLAMRDSTTLNEGVAVPLVELRRARSDGRTPYVLTGETSLRTPIGERLVKFEVKGDVAISGDPPKLTATGSKTTCRPGRSTMPQLPTPRLMGPPVPDIPHDPPGRMPGGREGSGQ